MKPVLVPLILLAAVGCSSTPLVREFPETANSTDELSRLENDLKVASESQQFDVLASESFEEAQDAAKTAAEDAIKGKSRKHVLHKVAVGRAYLDQATRNANLARKHLEGVIAARRAAIDAGAPQYKPEEFNDADDDLREVAEDIRDDDLDDIASSREDLQKKYLEIELESIKVTRIGPARDLIETARKEGAREYAPQTLAEAERKLIDTEQFIMANRGQTEAVKSRSAEALNAADRLLRITRTAKISKDRSPEEAAILVENERTRALESQKLLKAEKMNVEELTDQIASEKKSAEDLTGQANQLKAVKAFNQAFENARSQFTEDEAEVYRKGNKLVIRLRALSFPTNKSTLRASNFPLLSKVSNVVKEFDKPSLVVEGHTDAVGARALNQRLSTERAEAVSAYLVSSNNLDPNQVTTVGYGFERPLASNKTAEGKAQNRRVDVIIEPSSQPTAQGSSAQTN